MTALQLVELSGDGFCLKPAFENGRIVVTFTGSAESEAAAPLSDFLRQVHQEALRLGVTEVDFDIKNLSFMTSSCFKSFVTFADLVSRLDPVPYQVQFLANSNFYWQRRSLEALRRLAAKVVSVQST